MPCSDEGRWHWQDGSKKECEKVREKRGERECVCMCVTGPVGLSRAGGQGSPRWGDLLPVQSLPGQLALDTITTPSGRGKFL